jgi:hypothetical protein
MLLSFLTPSWTNLGYMSSEKNVDEVKTTTPCLCWRLGLRTIIYIIWKMSQQLTNFSKAMIWRRSNFGLLRYPLSFIDKQIRCSCSVLKVIASMLHMVAIDFTIAPLSPTLVGSLSPHSMSSQETFLGSTSLDEITASLRLASDALAVW